MDFVEEAEIQQRVMSLPFLVPSCRKLGYKVTCETKLFIYMTFDITKPRWCLYLKNLILFLLIFRKCPKKFAIAMSPLNQLCFHLPHRQQSFCLHVSSACVLPWLVVGCRFLKYHLEILKQNSLKISSIFGSPH